ncbi:GNAT family N-acetyltransferase [Paenibacillus sp. GCM10027626]|uniref:GNAT family N-acetyltransferase n=1 Tax=Paenibacillus sp. GCM10027626 TaxID=3273411 RepID=UPI00364209AF
MSINIPEHYTVCEQPPTAEQYVNLRTGAGLSAKSLEAAAAGLPHSIYGVTLFYKDTAIGMGRIIGDGGTAYQIVDIAVLPAHQKKGLGKVIMHYLTQYLDCKAHPTAYVSLIADLPADKLYEQFGFAATAPASIGMYKRY